MAHRTWWEVGARVLVAGCFVVAGFGLWVLAGGPLRMLCGLAWLVFALCAVGFAFDRCRRGFIVSGIVVGALAASPVEVSLARRHGPPGIVPVVKGYPSPWGFERARRGDVVLAGCVATGLEPRWVVVWPSGLSREFAEPTPPETEPSAEAGESLSDDRPGHRP